MPKAATESRKLGRATTQLWIWRAWKSLVVTVEARLEDYRGSQGRGKEVRKYLRLKKSCSTKRKRKETGNGSLRHRTLPETPTLASEQAVRLSKP